MGEQLVESPYLIHPVEQKTVGLYRTPVVVLDFASLYPSLFRAYNMCGTYTEMDFQSHPTLHIQSRIDLLTHICLNYMTDSAALLKRLLHVIIVIRTKLGATRYCCSSLIRVNALRIEPKPQALN